jgi:hypothetical protein
MSNSISPLLIIQFFNDIYKLIRDTDNGVHEIWYEFSDITNSTQLDRNTINELLENFNFLKKQRGNYINYISINKIHFILEALRFIELDLQKLSEILDFNGFESLIYEILLKNQFYAIKNFRFSDKSMYKTQTKQTKYEIDVIGLNKNYLLIIDAKQWRKKDSFSSMNKAANLQLRRVNALKKNPDVFTNLIHKLLGLRHKIKDRLPFKLIPMMVTLEDNFSRLNDKLIPLVSIYKFPAFLQEFEKYLQYYNIVKIKKISIQKTLI